jgi:two-component system sensor histidine kinase AlgZ
LQNQQQFLPDFCALRIVLLVLIVGELFAIILTISSTPINMQAWDSLALRSLYIQWNGLLSIAFLCILRKFISGYHRYLIATISYTGLLFLFLLISDMSYYLIQFLQMQTIIMPGQRLYYNLHNIIIGGIISGIILRYLYIQHQWKLQTQAEAETKLQLLQARIRPHFLFNSMNTIASLTRSNPPLAETITINLVALFRVLFQEKQSLVSWDKELKIAKQYLEIESLRFADRLSIQWLVEAMPRDALLPILTLQPLLENAIYHGIEPSIKGGKIIITAKKKDQQIQINITNSQSKSANTRKGNKMAIENIRQRLYAYFKNEATLELQDTENEFKVTLIFPYHPKKDKINHIGV